MQQENNESNRMHGIQTMFLWAWIVFWGSENAKLRAQDREFLSPVVKQRIADCEAELAELKRRDDGSSTWNQHLNALEELKVLQRRLDDHYSSDLSTKLSEDIAVATRVEKIADLERELHQLRRPEYQIFLENGQQLCEERHRILESQPVPTVIELQRIPFDVLTFPKIDGSTSTQPLASLIVSRYFDLGTQWVSKLNRVRFGSDIERFFSDDVELALSEYTLIPTERMPSQKRLAGIAGKYLIANRSTHQAYLNIADGTSGIGLLARKPNKEELEYAHAKQVEFEVVPCARDAFVFIVSSQSQVKGLSTRQIQSIYAGETTQWSEIDSGMQGKIRPYRRPENSGSEELMRELFMKDIPMPAKVSQELVGSLMSSVFLNLTSDHDGLAYSVRYYEHYMSGSAQTRAIAIDGIPPTAETIRDGSYPYLADVYAVVRRGKENDTGPQQLLKWLLSPEGQAVVEQSGYVAVTDSNENGR